LKRSLKSPPPCDPAFHWYRLVFALPARSLADAEATLTALGAISLTLKDAADQPLLEPAPGETPLWERLIIEALFSADVRPAWLVESLQQTLPFLAAADITVSKLENRVWERVWMDRFKPMSFGRRLWIYPSHIRPDGNANVNVILDPGLAFGTGTHATTALCLRWLDAQNLDGKTVIDYGCGSGVLAIAAIKLGAKKAYAVDIDEQALLATRENARLNQVNKRLEVCHRDRLPAASADIVLANIISSILIRLRGQLTGLTRTGGQLVMSGILPEQLDEIRRAYGDVFEFMAEQRLDDWCLLEGKIRH
jgi:ribosomal protein L11 methyltransferase